MENKRIVISGVYPEIDCGLFPVKRVPGEKVKVQADIFAHGHDEIAAALLYRHQAENSWRAVPMRYIANDSWAAEFTVEHAGIFIYTLEGWVDHFSTWRKDLRKKWETAQAGQTDFQIGAAMVKAAAGRADGDNGKLSLLARKLEELSQGGIPAAVELALSPELFDLMKLYPDRSVFTRYEKELKVVVDIPLANFSAWYEIFPRSCDGGGVHGTFAGCEAIIPEIARMGFDIVYLPPVHPIGIKARKGKNNSPQAAQGEPGSPWAIGSPEGGHKTVNPALGGMEAFEHFVKKARQAGLEVAMDLAFQCSPDHPYVKEHPEWFKWRPDGTVQFAENPPKKYEDIIPFDFETPSWKELWDELKGIALFWMDKGIRVFRVDNPHTKPFAFWQWLISEIMKISPDVIFLSEAFTRPKPMHTLAKLGFTQSYTYFTWRNSKTELTDYFTELTATEASEYFRPNLWANTPDILPEYLQFGGRAAFVIRLVLAATLSSNYGIYGPAFELFENSALPGREEYLDSEKYEIKKWDRGKPDSLADLIAHINRIRRENPALHKTSNLRFYDCDNDSVIFYGKLAGDNAILVAASLDPFRVQSARLRVPVYELGIERGRQYLVHDLLGGDKLIWTGEFNTVELDPRTMPARIFRVHARMRREADFDYFM
ncbi:MAG: alpha-1,4-glucan--maltose-1-phosphate maltosyltransferase [Actinomycetota bacterium]|nr:alpha-1,4-glucan--maltose-1-phosphate maltosyltransferase [Actinomycetota bacterium]